MFAPTLCGACLEGRLARSDILEVPGQLCGNVLTRTVVAPSGTARLGYSTTDRVRAGARWASCRTHICPVRADGVVADVPDAAVRLDPTRPAERAPVVPRTHRTLVTGRMGPGTRVG